MESRKFVLRSAGLLFLAVISACGGGGGAPASAVPPPGRTVRWTAPSLDVDNNAIQPGDIRSYEIYVNETGSFRDGDGCAVVAGDQATYQLRDYQPLTLVAGKSYFLSVRTVTVGGKSRFSDAVSFVY